MAGSLGTPAMWTLPPRNRPSISSARLSRVSEAASLFRGGLGERYCRVGSEGDGCTNRKATTHCWKHVLLPARGVNAGDDRVGSAERQCRPECPPHLDCWTHHLRCHLESSLA